jgi:hypothetical protein
MLIRAFVLAVVSSVLMACGGGGGSPGTNPNSPLNPPSPVITSSSPGPTAIELLANAPSLPSGGGEVLITAVVKDANNISMSGQSVTFSVDSGSLSLGLSGGTTNGAGLATANLTAGADKSSRNITVRARAGNVQASLIIPVTGTKIKITGPLTLQAGDSIQYSVKLTDSLNAPVSGQAVRLTSSLNNTISNSGSGTTDFNGVFTFSYTANNAGTDVITATGQGSSDSISTVISNVDFVFLSPSLNTVIPVGSSQAVTVRYRLGPNGVSGQQVSFSATRGTLAAASAITNANGEATVNISSVSAGLASIVANIPSVGQISLPLQFISTTPSSLALQANPGAILPNTNGTSVNQATLEAIVRDINGNAVSGRQVNFNIISDTSGGQLSQPSAVTDINGRASVQYISGASSTASNGVVVQAAVASTAISTTTSLTVNGESLFISIAFGNVLSNLDITTYQKQFSVYVTDANGVAVGNKDVTLRAIPLIYGKGELAFFPAIPATPTTSGIAGGWRFANYTACPNEDINLNGSINPGEDVNGNGELEPGLPVVIAPGTVRTDSNGFATFNLLYGEQYAYWLDVRLEARATVGGTESVRSIRYSLEALNTDVSVETVTPANSISPFGRIQSCTIPN